MMYGSVLLVAMVACSGSAQGQKCTSDQRCETGDGVDAQTDLPGVSDAGSDPRPDGPTCPGRWVHDVRDLVNLCLDGVPTSPLSIPQRVVIDTDDRHQCASTNDDRYCVLAGTQISNTGGIRATGTRPLVLFATDLLVSSALIDVGSHHGEDPEIGAGADPLACNVSGATMPGVGGGGAGGSFGGAGGAGAGVGGDPGAVGAITELRGGCPGQAGAGGTTSSAGGHGGGAVYLISNKKIIATGGINASGESGAGGIAADSGGGGGGAGGMIAFDAPIVTGSGLILANGGGGGEGGSETAAAHRGGEPSGLAPAAGGAGSPGSGDGGNGAALTPAEAGSAGTTGGGGVATGGGGGGGAGVVRAPSGATLGKLVSPSVIP